MERWKGLKENGRKLFVGCHRFAPDNDLEGKAQNEKILGIGYREGQGPKTGRSASDEKEE